MPTHQILATEEMVGSGHATKADTLNRLINLIAAQGDLLYGTAAATAARLAKGAADALIGMNDADTAPEYKTLKVTTAGQATNASQPAFLAVAAEQLNVTGDNTVYVATFGSEIFDQGNRFDGTSTFTAPVTGRYQLGVSIGFAGVANTHTAMIVTLETSNRVYPIFTTYAPFGAFTTDGVIGGSVLADMDAGDTAIVKVAVYGTGKAVDITAGSRFSGHLVC